MVILDIDCFVYVFYIKSVMWSFMVMKGLEFLIICIFEVDV